MPEEIEQVVSPLERQFLELGAKIEALETITRALFGLILSGDGKTGMKQTLEKIVFPLLLQQTSEKQYPGITDEMRNWLVNREIELLQGQFRAFLDGIDAMRAASHKNRTLQ